MLWALVGVSSVLCLAVTWLFIHGASGDDEYLDMTPERRALLIQAERQKREGDP